MKESEFITSAAEQTTLQDYFTAMRENKMGEKYPALRYNKDIIGNGKDYKDGIWEIEINSWEDYENKINCIKTWQQKQRYPENTYVWRGQNTTEELKPNIYRKGANPDEIAIKKHLDQFKTNIPGSEDLKRFFINIKDTPEFKKELTKYYEEIHPKKDINDPNENYENDFIDSIYWSIGQHHDLITPLLDWTMSPYVSLFFALRKKLGKDKKSRKRMVLGLNKKIKVLYKPNIKPQKRYIEFLTNLNIVHTFSGPSALKESIHRMFKRINTQEGLFTRLLFNESVENHVKRCCPHYEKNGERIVFLIKILIPEDIKVRKDCLKKLEEKGITYKTLYPDLQGAALHCNLNLEMNSEDNSVI